MMRQRKYLGFLLNLILLLSGCSRKATDYLQRGKTLFDAGKYSDAALEFRKTIQKDANLGEAYYRLALADEALGQFPEAFQALTRAVALTPQNTDAVVKLGDLSFEGYISNPRRPKPLYDNAKAMADRLIAKDPQSPDGLRLRGNLALLDQRPREAVEFLQNAIRVQPANGGTALSLVQALIASNRASEAEQFALQFIQNQKDYSAMYDVLYRQYQTANRRSDAERILKTKISNNPKSAAYVLQLAEYYVQGQKQDLVAATLQPLLDNPSDFPQARLLVGDFYSRMGNMQEALRQLEEGSKANPKDNSAYQVRIAAIQSSQGRNDQAMQTLEGVLKEHPDSREAATAHAALLMASRKPESIQTAVSELKNVVQRYPDDAALRYDLGLAYALSGELGSARAELREALRRQSGMNRARFLLANIALSQNDTTESLRYTDEILARTPDDGSARLVRAEVLMRLGRYGETRAELERLSRQFPDAPQVQLQIAELAVLEKKYADAERTLEKLRASGREPVRATLGLAETYARQRQYEKALQLLSDESRKTENASVRKLLAETALRARKYDVAATEYARLLAASPRSVDLLLGMGQVYEAQGDLEKAIGLYRQAQHEAPTNVLAASHLAGALQATGNSRDALSIFKQLATSRPEDPDVLNNVAYMLCETGGSPDEALSFAQRAIQRAPHDPAIVDTLAWVYLKKGKTEDAVRLFGSVIQKDPANPTFRFHLGVALLQKGDKQKAKAVLQDALDRGPAPPSEKNIRALLAGIS
jgi:tetratricopeptide (TPR) repeat protein